MQEAPIIRTSQTLKLITYGRNSGLPHVVELRYAALDNSFLVLAGSPRSDWVLNALRAREAKVRLGELVTQVTVTVADKSELSATIVRFRRQYGSQIVDQWYGTVSLCLKLVPFGGLIERGQVRGENQTLLNFDQWKQQRGDYYQSVKDAFDSASEEYDFTISRNYINAWIRKRSIGELLKLTGPEDVLVEIGCGTGAEAIQISKHVRQIIATDISPSMLAILRRKIASRKLETKITTGMVSASEINNIQNLLPNGKARIVYSFNGALNCEPGINKVPRALSEIIDSNGYFLCSIRNTLCLSEALTHSAAFQFDKMATRKAQPVMVSVGGKDIPSYYYSPASFAKLFQPFFNLRKMIGLPAVLPPAYLSNYYLRTGRARSLIEKFESALGPLFPLNRFGDQTLFVFQGR